MFIPTILPIYLFRESRRSGCGRHQRCIFLNFHRLTQAVEREGHRIELQKIPKKNKKNCWWTILTELLFRCDNFPVRQSDRDDVFHEELCSVGGAFVRVRSKRSSEGFPSPFPVSCLSNALCTVCRNRAPQFTRKTPKDPYSLKPLKKNQVHIISLFRACFSHQPSLSFTQLLTLLSSCLSLGPSLSYLSDRSFS